MRNALIRHATAKSDVATNIAHLSPSRSDLAVAYKARVRFSQYSHWTLVTQRCLPLIGVHMNCRKFATNSLGVTAASIFGIAGSTRAQVGQPTFSDLENCCRVLSSTKRMRKSSATTACSSPAVSEFAWNMPTILIAAYSSAAVCSTATPYLGSVTDPPVIWLPASRLLAPSAAGSATVAGFSL
jgi:hypothetical protein